jgi:hypothetical protein
LCSSIYTLRYFAWAFSELTTWWKRKSSLFFFSSIFHKLISNSVHRLIHCVISHGHFQSSLHGEKEKAVFFSLVQYFINWYRMVFTDLYTALFRMGIFRAHYMVWVSHCVEDHFGSFHILVINNFLNIIIFEQSKPASLCHCLLVICHLGSLDHTIKKSEDLHDVIWFKPMRWMI